VLCRAYQRSLESATFTCLLEGRDSQFLLLTLSSCRSRTGSAAEPAGVNIILPERLPWGAFSTSLLRPEPFAILALFAVHVAAQSV